MIYPVYNNCCRILLQIILGLKQVYIHMCELVVLRYIRKLFLPYFTFKPINIHMLVRMIHNYKIHALYCNILSWILFFLSVHSCVGCTFSQLFRPPMSYSLVTELVFKDTGGLYHVFFSTEATVRHKYHSTVQTV